MPLSLLLMRGSLVKRRRATPASVEWSIGIAWCASFHRRSLFSSFWIRSLRHAYLGPAHLAHGLQAAGHCVAFVACDEKLDVPDFDGTNDRIDDSVDLLHIATHGRTGSTGYAPLFRTADWTPTATGLGGTRLKVVAFETCNLIDPTAGAPWQASWSNLGQSVRILLGFEGLVAMDRPSALRGQAFADNLLHGDPFAKAWIDAAHSTGVNSSYNTPIAIGIGDTLADARNVLATASLLNPPSPWSGGTPFFEVQR